MKGLKWTMRIVNRRHSFSEKENKWHEHPRYFTHELCFDDIIGKVGKDLSNFI